MQIWHEITQITVWVYFGLKQKRRITQRIKKNNQDYSLITNKKKTVGITGGLHAIIIENTIGL